MWLWFVLGFYAVSTVVLFVGIVAYLLFGLLSVRHVRGPAQDDEY
ncbi:MAG: hypothetical protein ACLQOO_08540 [Terriglobia bacterium]